jgi:hypothetical protein
MRTLATFTYRKNASQKIRLRTIRVCALIVICLTVISATFIHSSIAMGESREPMTVVVADGDTLWKLASINAPRGMDVRAYIEEIININSLTDSIVYPGQALLLP